MRIVPTFGIAAPFLAATLIAGGLAAAAPAPAPNPKLANPAALNETAPETYRAKFTTTKGDFVIEVTRDWAPNGADRFYNLVKIGYLNNVARQHRTGPDVRAELQDLADDKRRTGKGPVDAATESRGAVHTVTGTQGPLQAV